MKGERIRGAGLRVRLSCRLSPALSPSNSRKDSRQIYIDHFFHVWGRHSWAFAPNEGLRVSVRSGETATLARVLRATDAYSIAWGKFYFHNLFASTTTSRSQSHRLKAAEVNLSVLQEMRKGSGVSNGRV